MESRTWLYLLAAAAVATAIAVPVMAGQRVRLPAGGSVLLFGDSLAQGMGPPMGALARDAGVPFQADGRPSTRLDQWLGQGWAEADLANAQASIAFVSLGTNDAGMAQQNPEAFAQRAKDLVSLAQKYGTVLVWIVPPSMPFETSAALDGINASGAATFVYPSDLPRGPDNVHPTIEGFAQWAAGAWSSISPPPGRGLSGDEMRFRAQQNRRRPLTEGRSSLGGKVVQNPYSRQPQPPLQPTTPQRSTGAAAGSASSSSMRPTPTTSPPPFLPPKRRVVPLR